MNVKMGTMLVVGLLFVIAVAWDVYALMVGGTEASISHLIIEWAYNYPIMPFACGFLMGHLFWRMRQTRALNKRRETRVEL